MTGEITAADPVVDPAPFDRSGGPGPRLERQVEAMPDGRRATYYIRVPHRDPGGDPADG